MKIWKALVHRIRLWDTGWNPFFSLSLRDLELGKNFVAGFKQGLEKGLKK